MEKRRIGTTDLWTAPLAFGGNVFGWTADERHSFQILDAFTDAGFNLIDTADSYSTWVPGHKGGESETIIGNWLQKHGGRDSLILATKVGSDMGQGKTDLSRAHIFRSVENSLKRLKTDYIDVYQTHWDDLDTSVEETLEAYAELVTSGKVRWIGVSNVSPERIHTSMEVSAIHGFPSYQTLQPNYNLYDRAGYEAEFAPVAEKYGFSVLPYFSLAKGFLTGKYRSEADLGKSVRGGGIKSYLDARGMAILDALDTVSQKHGTKPAAVALAWLLTRPHIAAPIASATNLDQLQVLTDAAGIQLDDEDVALLNRASS